MLQVCSNFKRVSMQKNMCILREKWYFKNPRICMIPRAHDTVFCSFHIKSTLVSWSTPLAQQSPVPYLALLVRPNDPVKSCMPARVSDTALPTQEPSALFPQSPGLGVALGSRRKATGWRGSSTSFPQLVPSQPVLFPPFFLPSKQNVSRRHLASGEFS